MTNKIVDEAFNRAMKEFDACKELVRQYERLCLTAPVDDDFPQVKFEYDQAVTAFMEAANANRNRTTSLTFERVAALNLARCKRWHGKVVWSLSDWGVAMAGEAGEACNVIKKLNRLRDGMSQKAVDPKALQSKLAQEIADTFLYLDLLAQAADLDLAECVVHTFNEVSKREGFPERL